MASTVSASADVIHALHGLWSETLDRVDRTDIRSSVRPHEHRRSSTVGDPTPPGGAVTMPAPSEAGLEDLDGMRSGRERFILGEMLGRGGMSVVLQAAQRSLGRSVAVKVARYDLDPRQRERFRAESKLTAWLEHPNITPIYEAGRNYLVMRRIVGRDLEHQIERELLPLPRLIEVLIKVCDAVSYAHHRGIIHRDIKPENILVGDFGEVMLIDWGLALSVRAPADGILRAPAVDGGAALCAGTPGYMAPEMALADAASVGTGTDVFLLGATLYRCLGGGIPFQAEDVWRALERSATNSWTPIPAQLAPARLIALQQAAMSDRPADRPTVAEFQDGLRSWLMHARSEDEARLAVAEARARLAAAQGHRLHPHASYQDFVACIAACDRALALQPELDEALALRGRAVADFALAAVGAGELQLSRLIKEGGRLPGPPIVRSEPDDDTTRKAGRLLPQDQQQSAQGLLRELVVRQREIERLAASNAQLRTAYDAVVRDRDAASAIAETEHARLGRRIVLLGILLTCAVLAALAAARW
ncbi:MAG: serine/threonine protein kinase [Planctomycetes bacterium]|nr:serine/threonine protein kinase [Planctomycetota bacterium]